MRDHAGQLLRHWRQHQGVSQFQLTQLSGISQRHLSFIENGKAQATKPTLLALARALILSPEQTDMLLVRGGFRPLERMAAGAAPDTARWQKILSQLPPSTPAAVVCQAWDVHASNVAFNTLTAELGVASVPEHKLNLLTLFMAPSPLCEWIHDGQSLGRGLIQQLIQIESTQPQGSRVSAVIEELRSALDLLISPRHGNLDLLPSAFEVLIRTGPALAMRLGVVSTYLDPVGPDLSTNNHRLLLVNRTAD